MEKRRDRFARRVSPGKRVDATADHGRAADAVPLLPITRTDIALKRS